MYKMNPTDPRMDYLFFKQHQVPAQLGTTLTFLGVDGYDVYNTSVPFVINRKRVMAGRVEPRENSDARIMFFEETTKGWQLMKDAFVFHAMEDPFITFISGHAILGGVHAIWRSNGDLITYHTDFYCVDDLCCPIHVLQGPSWMKDIRLLQLPNGKIAIFSRPNGEAIKDPGITSAIGFTVADNLSEVTQEVIALAPLIEWAFRKDEWGGVNQLHNLKNGLIGIIGHKAWGEHIGNEHILHYYSFASVLDPQKHTISPFELISVRECFPEGPGKRSTLKDVCFTSGIERMNDGTALLYSGLSDTQEGVIRISDPFAAFEK